MSFVVLRAFDLLLQHMSEMLLATARK